jgi:hypothetical protein
MVRTLPVALLLVVALCACSSSSSSPSTGTGTSGGGSSSGSSGACPNVAGAWKITAHCDASLVGQALTITQTDCALAFSAPFNGFTSTLTTDGKISVSGPQTCTGTAAASAISMTCTPGTCLVTLGR